MTSKKLRLISTVLALGLAFSAIAGPSRAVQYAFASHEDAIPGFMPPGADATTVFLDESGQVIPMPTTAAAEADGLWCTPVSGRDNPHQSVADVSGHGWWDKGSCSNNQADVWNCLAEWYTDNTWRWKACSPLTRLSPGGGAGNRTTARSYCETFELTSWRNYVDVNVVDEWDTAEQPYNGANVYCRVFSG
jgi:hypothetical protein